ncbi:MAG: hypothetical protein R3Y21_00185 [Mycoplasmatota bacterium]
MAKYDKKQAVDLILKKINKECFYTYKEIASITGYHEKYILKLKEEVLNRTVKLIHGNTYKKPINAISKEEEEKIVKLFKRSNTSVRKFQKFYSTRSYSCIYNILKKNNLI